MNSRTRRAGWLAISISILLILPATTLPAQEETPLWAYTPETISPEWGAFFATKGQNRGKIVPAPDDIEGWKAFQGALEKELEPLADDKAAAFGVTYKEYEIAGIPVVEVIPPEPVRADKIGV